MLTLKDFYWTVTTLLPWQSIVSMSNLARITGWVFQLRLNMLLEYTAAKTETRGGEVFRWQVLRDTCIPAKRPKLPVEECQKSDATYGSRSKSTRGFAWLFSAISAIRIIQCSDPRDEVYAALSIAIMLWIAIFATSLSPTILHLWQTSLQRTKIIIENSESINFPPFAEIEPLSGPPGLPTWVPDYSTSATVTALPLFRGFSHFDASLSRVSRDFNCSISGRYLALQGGRFDDANEVWVSDT
jgi:hypothetical protein